MGMFEVQNFLEIRRQETDQWFRIPEIIEQMRAENIINGSGRSVYDSLYRLSVNNAIEWKGQGFWKHQKLFRGKKKRD